MLTRQEMEAAIAGGSIVLGGRIITHVRDLPSETVLAQGDDQRIAAEHQRIDQEIARLLAEKVMLSPGLLLGSSTDQPPPTDSSTVNQPPAAATPLTDDFPSAAELRAAGYSTREAVAALSEEQLAAVPGIKPASAKQIRTALAG